MRLRLREWRRRRALSQSELAAMAGITKATVVALEKGDPRRPHPRTIRQLAQALGIEPDELRAPDDPEEEESR